MKKILSLFLSFCLVLSLSACGQPNERTNNTDDVSHGQSAPATSDKDSGGEISDANTEGSSADTSGDSLTNNNSTTGTNPDTPHTHSYSATVTKAATCTESGTKTLRCSCGHSYTESIAAKGHSWGEWSTTKQPTTSAEGNSQRKCSVCAAVENKAIAKLPEEPQTNVTAAQLKQIEEGFLRLVNAERSRLGATPLSINSHLDSVAQTRSAEIITSFSHTRPNGEMYFSLINNSAYPYFTCGENICMTSHKGNDYYTASDRWVGSATQIESAYSWIYTLFKNSPGHYQNMIKPDYKDCGIGISYTLDNNSGIPMFYIAHIFGAK